MLDPSAYETAQEAIGIAAIGDGYVLRTDGVAVGLAELTPPDVRLLDESGLALLLDAATHIFRTSGERLCLVTDAVPPDPRPLLAAVDQAQAQARDFTSYVVFAALRGMLDAALATLTHTAMVRWIMAVPSLAPEAPPPGAWGELFPATIVGQLMRLRGDPVAIALNSTRRLVDAFAGLGIEPPPRLLNAAEITALLERALDPIRAPSHLLSFPQPAPRPLQIGYEARQ